MVSWGGGGVVTPAPYKIPQQPATNLATYQESPHIVKPASQKARKPASKPASQPASKPARQTFESACIKLGNHVLHA